MEPILYKKKITTIVKEYYKILNDIVNGNNSNNGLYTVSPEIYSNNETLYPPPGQAAQYDEATFTSSIDSYFDSYGKKMQEMIATFTGPPELADAAEEEMFKNIWELGTILKPFYTAEFSEKVVQSLRALALLEIQTMSFAKAKLDIKQWTDRILNFPINDLAFNLNQYNNYLDSNTIRFMLLGVVNSWLDAINAKIAKDETKFNTSIAQASIGLKSFSNFLSRGIIVQQPNMFRSPATI